MKITKFYKVYFSVIAVALVLLVIAAFVLHSVLSAYESTRPAREAERVFNQYFVTRDFAGLMSEIKSDYFNFDDAERVKKGVTELYGNAELAYFTVSSSTEGEEKYAVTSDGKHIAYFTVSKSDEEGKYGFNHHKLSSAELFLPEYGDITVKVPEGYALKVNGKEVDNKYLIAANIEGDSCKYVPDGVKGITYSEYKIEGLFFEPEVVVERADGVKTEVELNEEKKYYTANVVFSDSLKDIHTDRVLEAATAYTAYLSKDGSFQAIAKYIDKSASIYNRVRLIETNWVRDHNGFAISDEQAFEFYAYSDDVFSCRVKLKETLMRPGYANHVENIDIILYWHKVNGQYLIYEIVANG